MLGVAQTTDAPLEARAKWRPLVSFQSWSQQTWPLHGRYLSHGSSTCLGHYPSPLAHKGTISAHGKLLHREYKCKAKNTNKTLRVSHFRLWLELGLGPVPCLGGWVGLGVSLWAP